MRLLLPFCPRRRDGLDPLDWRWVYDDLARAGVAGRVAGVVRQGRLDQRGFCGSGGEPVGVESRRARRKLRAGKKGGRRASSAPNVRGASGPWSRTDGACWHLDRPGLPNARRSASLSGVAHRWQ